MNKLTFVKQQTENDDIHTFYFDRPAGMHYKAGQHGIFLLAGPYRPHPFTLSSAPGEQYATISTHVDTGSRFKKKLLSLQPGASVYVLGPILNFTYDDTASSHVFLAQGIGITPFRSMLVHAHDNKLPVTTTLIHVDSKGHSFRELTEQYATHASYPTSSDDFRAQVQTLDPKQMFYLSGSPRFVSATRKLLRERGVDSKNIKADSFFGY